MIPYDWEIEQLIAPTERTYAVYKIGREEEKFPVILWALVKDTERPDQSVHGLIEEKDKIIFCEHGANFKGYE